MVFLAIGAVFATEGPSQASSDFRIWLAVFISTAVSGTATFLVTQWRALRKEEQDEKAAKEKSIIEHKEELIKRLDNEIHEKGRKVASLERDVDDKGAMLVELRASIRVARSHIRYLERILSAKQISFERYEDENAQMKPGTGEHSIQSPDTTGSGS